MPVPRRWFAALLTLGLLAAGCAGSGPTPLPTVRVHVANHLSDVVVTKVTTIPSWVGTPPPPDGFGFVAPCGGTADVDARVVHDDRGGGDLALAIDTSGVLNQMYPTQSLDPNESGMFNLSAIWTHGDLKGGEWIVVDPNVVTISTFEPPAPIAPCGSWTYSDPTPEAQ